MIAPPADPTRVRVAQPRDEDEVMFLCKRLHQENGIASICEDKVHAFLRDILVCQSRLGLIGLIGSPGTVEASICLVVEPAWYSNEPFLQEVWNYVLPEHRQSTNAKDMIAWAKQMTEPPPVGLGTRLAIGIMSNQQTEAKIRLYRKQLGDPSGAFWFYGSGHGQDTARAS